MPRQKNDRVAGVGSHELMIMRYAMNPSQRAKRAKELAQMAPPHPGPRPSIREAARARRRTDDQ